MIIEISPHVSMKFCWCPPGRFQMGSPQNEKYRFDVEGPQHDITIQNGFWITETQITQQQWETIAGNNPSHFIGGNNPVEQISWLDCNLWLKQLNSRVKTSTSNGFRLPSEEEWEYACRAGTNTPIYTGSINYRGINWAEELDEIAWYAGNSETSSPYGCDSSEWPEKQYNHTKASTQPVGLKAANAWGIYDMIGNVFEWCASSYREYSGLENPNLHSDTYHMHVVRGGCWHSPAWSCRSAYRFVRNSDYQDDGLGFRILIAE